MKGFLEKIKAMKGGVWVLALACCLLAALFLPTSGSRSASMTEEEQRFSATLSRIAGAGDTRVSIYYAQAASAFGAADRKPTGAVIVAKGAGNVKVRLDLLRAAQTLLGLSPQAVEVFEMEDKP
jgi:stage III sporulation protein AG